MHNTTRKMLVTDTLKMQGKKRGTAAPLLPPPPFPHLPLPKSAPAGILNSDRKIMDSTNCFLSKKRKEDTIGKKHQSHVPFYCIQKEKRAKRQTDGRWQMASGRTERRRKKDDFSKANFSTNSIFFDFFSIPMIN